MIAFLCAFIPTVFAVCLHVAWSRRWCRERLQRIKWRGTALQLAERVELSTQMQQHIERLKNYDANI